MHFDKYPINKSYKYTHISGSKYLISLKLFLRWNVLSGFHLLYIYIHSGPLCAIYRLTVDLYVLYIDSQWTFMCYI